MWIEVIDFLRIGVSNSLGMIANWVFDFWLQPISSLMNDFIDYVFVAYPSCKFTKCMCKIKLKIKRKRSTNQPTHPLTVWLKPTQFWRLRNRSSLNGPNWPVLTSLTFSELEISFVILGKKKFSTCTFHMIYFHFLHHFFFNGNKLDSLYTFA